MLENLCYSFSGINLLRNLYIFINNLLHKLLKNGRYFFRVKIEILSRIYGRSLSFFTLNGTKEARQEIYWRLSHGIIRVYIP